MQKLAISLLLIIFVGVVFHAPLSVFFGVQFPEFGPAIRAWKEVLLAIAMLLLGACIIRTKRYDVLRDKLLYACVVYACMHIVLLPVFWQGLLPSIAGLMIDLRYIAFFAAIYVALRLWPQHRRRFLHAGLITACISLLFACMQVFVLPIDILTYLGYSRDTIAPYLTIDRNYDFIRINGTLRGPNPLGAYAMIVLSACTAYVLMLWRKLSWKRACLVAACMALAGIALWYSYSRSALGASILALAIIGACMYGRRIPVKAWISAGAVAVAACIIVLANWNSTFVQNVLLHTNPEDGSVTQSNEEHWESLIDGSMRALEQPLGAGIGSTGSASLMGDGPGLIIENQFLFIAHEVGWPGLALFLVIFGTVLWRLWLRRSEWLALGMFASGIGCAAIGMLLPVFVDDTVGIVWWGLAAIALAKFRD